MNKLKVCGGNWTPTATHASFECYFEMLLWKCPCVDPHSGPNFVCCFCWKHRCVFFSAESPNLWISDSLNLRLYDSEPQNLQISPKYFQKTFSSSIRNKFFFNFFFVVFIDFLCGSDRFSIVGLGNCVLTQVSTRINGRIRNGLRSAASKSPQ